MTDKLITHEEAREINRIGKRTFISALDVINSEEVEVKQNNKNYVFPNDLDKIDEYITQQEQFSKDVADYFHVIEVFDKYKREHPDKTDDEIKEVLKEEVEIYRNLHIKLSKGVLK